MTQDKEDANKAHAAFKTRFVIFPNTISPSTQMSSPTYFKERPDVLCKELPIVG